MRIELRIDDPSVEGEDIIVESDSISGSISQLNDIIGRKPRMTRRYLMDYTKCVYGWVEVRTPTGNWALVPNWEEQRTILMIRRWLEPNSEPGKTVSFRDVANKLDAMGLSVPNDERSWSSRLVKQTLRYTIHDRIHEFEKPDWWE